MLRRRHMKGRISQIVLIVLLAICISSCVVPMGRVFSRYGLAFTEPKTDEIVGTWVADPTTLTDMRDRGKYNVNFTPEFIFQADGNFKMKNMPDWWKDGFGESHGGFETNSGMWKLVKSNCCWSITLHFNSPNLVTDVGLMEHRFQGQPQFLVEVVLGDPD